MRPSEARGVLSLDTSAEVERLQVRAWREMAVEAKASQAAAASAAIEQLAVAGICGRNPDATDAACGLELALLKIGRQLTHAVYVRGGAAAPRIGAVMDPLAVVLLVARAVEACGLRYVVGGSLASSVSGEPRATLDADVMVDLRPESIACLVAALGGDFHADADALARAVRERTSVNLIHLPSAAKVDLFVMGATPIEARQMERRQKIAVGSPPRAELYIYTAEDILLQKLRWFRRGGEVSDRQWRDVLGIVLVQGQRLDRDYLRGAASAIDVLDLLDRAFREAQQSGA